MARRPLNAFALSFLDCMCCGFGAVILVFMIISARIQQESEVRLEGLDARRNSLEARVLAGGNELARLRAGLDQLDLETAESDRDKQESSLELLAALSKLEVEVGRHAEASAGLDAQKKRLADLEEARKQIGSVAKTSESHLRSVVAQGNRQYLTGMKMGGRRILILMDASASMLASTLVNIVRLRPLPDEQKLRAKKWKQAVGTVDWLTANIPPDSDFQVFTFNTTTVPVLHEMGTGWIKAGDGKALDEVVVRLRKTAPEGGTSLHSAFAAAAAMKPPPDNIYLLVDGLPTRGFGPSPRKTVSGKERLRYFEHAVARIPKGVPVNVILFPMEGDPFASLSYWKLARATRGSFVSPSVDWP